MDPQSPSEAVGGIVGDGNSSIGSAHSGLLVDEITKLGNSISTEKPIVETASSSGNISAETTPVRVVEEECAE